MNVAGLLGCSPMSRANERGLGSPGAASRLPDLCAIFEVGQQIHHAFPFVNRILTYGWIAQFSMRVVEIGVFEFRETLSCHFQ